MTRESSLNELVIVFIRFINALTLFARVLSRKYY